MNEGTCLGSKGIKRRQSSRRQYDAVRLVIEFPESNGGVEAPQAELHPPFWYVSFIQVVPLPVHKMIAA